jgi:hypothetical protein
MRILISSILFFTLVQSITLHGQGGEIQQAYGNQISSGDLKDYLTILASDAMEGRKTGTRGQKMAAAFIANHFQEIGLAPPVSGGYYQLFELYTASVGDAYVKMGDSRFNNFGEIIYLGLEDTGGETDLNVVFAGKGREEDLQQVDVKGKGVVLMAPGVGGSNASLRSFSETVRDRGAQVVFIVTESASEQFHEYANQRKGNRSSSRLSFKKPGPQTADKGIFLINRPVAEKMFNLPFGKLLKTANEPGKNSLKKIRPGKVSYGVTLQVSTVRTENVVGFLEGTDKKEELVVVTAHYDHIGTTTSGEDRVNNGADDDGSGTVSVLEIAKTFASAKGDGHGPRRSMLFMTVTGEEQGLLGSQYYVEHPIYPLANTVVDLNIDMIGRVDQEHRDDPSYVYVIGPDKLSKELYEINENANRTYTRLKFDYTYNDENHPTNLYRRSDHWNFAKNGVPIVFYFDGIHEDYHRPSDEVSKINFDLLATRAQCIFYTAWEVANRPERIRIDPK